MKKILLITLVIVTSCSLVYSKNRELTYIDLIEKLTDLEQLALLPEKGETCRQWSSYDRSSKYDEETGKYVNWEANSDGFGGKGWIRKEGEELVLAEMKGPGCIWRIWSATPKDGHVRIYLDGSDTPAVDLPFIGYFNGENAPFNRDALVHIVASGKNNYVPIPYQKSCKIVADPDYGEFHHFNYTTFPKGTKVPTFSMNLSSEEAAALDKANERLKNCGPDFNGKKKGQMTESINLYVQPEDSQVVTTIKGARAIHSMIVSGQSGNDVELQRQVLRELVLKIYFDGEESPSVWCPLGDFFGTAPGINYYKSLPMGVTYEGGYSNWFMPFAEEAKIEIVNDGYVALPIDFEIVHAPLEQPAHKYGRFHAKWHRDAFLPEEKERWIDWPILKTSGRGRYVGVELEIWNPRGGWWGEGDEKFFVDGEKFPSTYGTGSEDYFGYAWSDPTLWENAYHNQTISEGNKGHISVNRWHIADNIPFQKSFEGCIEKYFSNERPTLYACMAYWYLEAGGRDPYVLPKLSERLNWYPELKYPLDIAGILVLEKPQGMIEAQGMGGFADDKWYNGEQLWWTGELGARLRIGIEVEKDGFYKILTRHTKAADYGIVQWLLDGEKAGKAMDFYYADGVIGSDQIDLGTYELKAGKHELNVQIVGSNPDAIERYMVGIDYLQVVPVEAPAQKPETPRARVSRPRRMRSLASINPDIPVIASGVQSRAITWENKKGLPGEGGKAANKLGVGRKGSPCMGWIENGKTATMMDIDGSGIIRHIWLTLPERAPDELRNIILRMYWDNSDVPSVEVPLGDFFGTAHGRAVNLDSSYLTVVNGKGFNCWFPMPFRRHAKITIENDMPDGKKVGCLFFQIDYELHDNLPENVGLFHAQFRRQNPTIPKQDYVLLDDVEGPGMFVGCVIGIRPMEPHWWGEGEMKFYIDGDTDFPTICGTGTEDYFGNAWGMEAYASRHFGCTVYDFANPEQGLKELISMYRFHELDPVYFNSGFKATIQQIGWFPDGLGERNGDDWSSVAYWYQAEPVKKMPPLPDRQARTEGIVPNKAEKDEATGQWGDRN